MTTGGRVGFVNRAVVLVGAYLEDGPPYGSQAIEPDQAAHAHGIGGGPDAE